jgi:hypothetical protein
MAAMIPEFIAQAEMPWQLLADLVLTTHVALVIFVAGGLALILIGNRYGWNWVNRLWFRLLHLAAIAFVVAETWIGLSCPLTTLEMWLRAKARTGTYSGGFIEYWLQRLLYYDAPAWVFAVGYTLFGLVVVATWRYFPPTRQR